MPAYLRLLLSVLIAFCFYGRSKKTTPEGFEPSRAEPIGLAGRRLNHSAKVSVKILQRE